MLVTLDSPFSFLRCLYSLHIYHHLSSAFHFKMLFPSFKYIFLSLQEKVKGKNKLVPRLLGITKESVVRVDEKTKEVIKIYIDYLYKISLFNYDFRVNIETRMRWQILLI